MITYKKIEIEAIDTIKPLWDKLSAYHKNVSEHFSKDFEEDNYLKRKKVIQEKEEVHILLAYYHHKPVAYLIASIDDAEAEIDSLYVDTHYRGSEIGDELMKQTLQWIKGFSPEAIKVSVAYGNQVSLFYERYGFLPRSIIYKASEESVG